MIQKTKNNIYREKPDIKGRNRKHAGFTLAETLLTVLILLLVSVIVVTGIPAAKNAYEKIVLGSNAQVLLTTTIEALRGELGTAWDVKVNEDKITYYSGDTASRSQIYMDDKVIMVQRIFGDGGQSGNGSSSASGTGANSDKYPLVSADATKSDIYVQYGDVHLNDGVIQIQKLEVCRKSNNNVLASVDDGVIIQTFADAAGIDTITDDDNNGA